MDAFSSFMIGDLLEAYQQMYRGEAIRLPSKTTSFKYWAERLETYTRSDSFQTEIDYWLHLPWERIRSLPRDKRNGPNNRASSVPVEVSLSKEETVILFEILKLHVTPLHMVFLTALAQALAKWTGSSTVAVDLMRHGRDAAFADIDLSRTVGNFITYVPVVIDLKGKAEPAEALKAVREQYNRIPIGGIGYGLLRNLKDNEGFGERLRSISRPEIAFNNRAQFSRDLDEISSQDQNLSGPFRTAEEGTGPPQSETSMREHLIVQRADITNGRLQFGFTYSKNFQRRSTVDQLINEYMESLRSLMEFLLGQ